ncbi:MAG: hypothetical protein K8823_45 [Cenarchaeum symbiont of Oopsacas minuta]|nr:hypothetical protein [Cenarchaeum symbiont of Oopsacas minuta]
MSQLVHGPERVEILKPCPISVSNHSLDIQKNLQEIDLESKDAILPIHVARTADGTTYVVDGQMRVEEIKRRKIKTADAYVHKVNDISDVVILHVRLHQSSPTNPLGLIDAYNYLKKFGIASENILKMLWLDPMQKYIATHKIDLQARELLEVHLQKMTEKFSRMTYPMYMIAMLCKLEPKTQRRAVENIINHMSLDCTRARFSFPSAGQIDALVSEAKSKNIPEPVIFDLDDREFKDLDTSNEDTVKRSKKKIDPFHGLGHDLYSHLQSSRNEAILPCRCGIMYKVNIKTRSMSEIKVKDDAIAIEHSSNAPIAAIPPTIVNKLGAQVGEDVFFRVSTAKSLSKLLAKKSHVINF